MKWNHVNETYHPLVLVITFLVISAIFPNSQHALYVAGLFGTWFALNVVIDLAVNAYVYISNRYAK